ncbi:MAG: hypothetical protein K2I35_02015 [Duncaniella sp.]|nr:hypothetical protein [Duncaniella sp.]
MNSEELTVGDTRRLYRGSAVVILRSTQAPGEVKLKVTPAKLKPTTLKLHTN